MIEEKILDYDPKLVTKANQVHSPNDEDVFLLLKALEIEDFNEIIINDAQEITTHGLNYFFQYFPKKNNFIEILILQHTKLDDKSLELLSKSQVCQTIKILNISHSLRTTSKGFEALFFYWPEENKVLKNLDLSYNDVDDESLLLMRKNDSTLNLAKINFKHCQQITSMGFQALLDAIKENLPKRVDQLKILHFDFSDTQFDEFSLQQINNQQLHPFIQSLDLSRCSLLSGKSFCEFILTWNPYSEVQLTDLNLSGTLIDQKFLQCLATNPRIFNNLLKLNLSFCSQLSNENFQSFIVKIEEMRGQYPLKLQYLNLEKVAIKDSFLMTLGKSFLNFQLSYLNISDCSSFSSYGLEKFFDLFKKEWAYEQLFMDHLRFDQRSIGKLLVSIAIIPTMRLISIKNNFLRIPADKIQSFIEILQLTQSQYVIHY